MVVLKSLLLKIKQVPETQHSVWMLGGQFLVSTSAFVLTYVLANYVSKEVVGEYRFVLAVYATVSVLSLNGIGTALMQSVAAGTSGSVFQAFRKKLQYGLIGTLIFCGLAGYYLVTTGNTPLMWALILCAILLPPLEAYGLYGSYLQGAAVFKLSAIFQSVDRIVTTSAVVLSVFIAPALLPIVSTYLIAHGVTVFALYKVSLRKTPPNDKTDPTLLPYAKHITFMSLIGSVTAQLDKYVLFFFFGPVPLALYWIASVLPQEVARVVSVVSSTFFPRYVSMEHTKLVRTVRRLYWLSSGVLALVCVAYYFLAPYIFHIFLPQYKDADGISVVLMVGFGFIPYLLVWQIFSAKKNVPALYYLSIGEPLIIVTLYLTLIPFYGIWGIAFTLLGKMLVMNGLAIWYLYQKNSNL